MGRILIVMIFTLTLPLSVGAAKPVTAQCPKNLEAIKRVAPVNPSTPMATNISGWVLVKFVVTEIGSTVSPVAVESSSMVFERSALQAILQYRFPKQEFRCVHGVRIEFLVERTPGAA